MTWEVAQPIAAVVLCAAMSVAAGCSADGSKPSTGAGPQKDSSPTTAATPSRTPGHTATPGVPTPGSTERPATSSGPLSAASFPDPRRLGPGWRYAVDPGDAEEGYAGNGTPTLARDPEEIVQTAVPLGCARPAAMPAPAHALEADYTLHGRKVIAVRGSFRDARAAGRFFGGRTENLRACTGRAGSPAIGPLVTAVASPSKDALSSRRTPRSDPWAELCLLDGDSVVLLAAQGKDPFTDGTTRRLVRLFRS